MRYYILLYNMNLKNIHSPTLDSIIMVERLIQKNSEKYGKYQLWKKLPKKMMYQTFQIIMKYLQDSRKITIDRYGFVVWIHDKEIKK